jgi:hypothetical protein
MHCAIGRCGFHHSPAGCRCLILNWSSMVSLSLILGKVFHPSPLCNCRKGQNFGRKGQMTMPDVYVRDTEAEGERWIERNREK